ncbi:nicotinate-nucleotide adenylyltransferase [Celerinatantimonas diazotrophica]|uniref:Probable nicotinate-nucleotide adenylyltransferase n=1 Tax=Celerinatantimonas diazotrophica TaxID=412034 RepID=A0A4R1K3K2_9GAMM|nr:nicotinate-nucleotide adenylyltransferase [Celerinatantimonas diazotrophica]TCK58642.1 nicotinate-nucleotide adenylyltransferase [Celerinatantimonas diazotrophica]CAG9297271.1 Nicotinate-nucleotide adenylyltransferase [Celerinatantimonas diazotrophica]
MPNSRLYLGGSFDPIHHGHLNSLEQLRTRLQLDTAFLMPAWRSPLKDETNTLDKHRLEMLELAIQEYPNLQIERYEIERPSPSYTSQTLAAFRARYPQDSIIFAMGMDSFQALDKWANWQQLTTHAHLAVFARPGYKLMLNQSVAHFYHAHQADNKEQLTKLPCGKIWLTELEPFDMASSSIREQLQCDPNNAKKTLPSSVFDYIQQHHLYL